jgi:hypothetical protein
MSGYDDPRDAAAREWATARIDEIDARTESESSSLLCGFAVFVIGALSFVGILTYIFA